MNILMPGSGTDAVPPSLALAIDERRWLLLNVSAEAMRDARLQAAAAAGEIVAVVLLDRDFDHTAGLHALCGGTPLDVFTTPAVFEGLADAAPTLGLLDERCALRWHLLPVAGDVHSVAFRLPGVDQFECRLRTVDAAETVGERNRVEIDDRRTGQCLVYAGGERPRWTHPMQEHGT
ncbi:MAG: hypothetical protein KF788_10820 [Piscinibacter sp.]|nr:hypothetical protein [Piscinibacter sp.]